MAFNTRDSIAVAGLTFAWLAVAVAALAAGWQPTADDGYYYLLVADHLAAGHGSTFDGVQLTNGYQPLWALLLTAIASTVDSLAALRAAALGTQVLLIGLALGFSYSAARRVLSRLASIVVSSMWLALSAPFAMAGLELALHACLFLATVAVLAREPGGLTRGRALWLGTALALAVLARLDVLLWVAVLALWFLPWRQSLATSTRWLTWSAIWLPAATIGVAYAVVNRWLFGLAMPISGVVKRQWSSQLLAVDPWQEHGVLVAKFVHMSRPLSQLIDQSWLRPLGLGLIAAVWLLLIDHRRGRRSVITPLAIYALLHFFAYGLVFHDDLSFAPWYWVAQPWLAAFLVGYAVDVTTSEEGAIRR